MGLVLAAAGIIVTSKIDPSLLQAPTGSDRVSACRSSCALAVIFMPVAKL